MKTISIFDLQDINTLLKEYEYQLKLKDVCGNQSLLLECLGETKDVQDLCNIINTVIKQKHLQVKPGTINPLQLVLF